MKRISIRGLGAVSPAGWGVAALRDAASNGAPLPSTPLARPGWNRPLPVRPVPAPPNRPTFLSHPRLRRAGAISHYVMAAALEALGGDADSVQNGSMRLGIVACAMAGCVVYSRRFFEETLANPATASPLLFPETVLNAPASHLAACLGADSLNYTLVGDSGTFLQGLALAADWLMNERVDGCVVIGAEEMDWLPADALRLFRREAVYAAGAGALYLRGDGRPADDVELACVTDSVPFSGDRRCQEAVRRVRAQLAATRANDLLCLSGEDLPTTDATADSAWSSWVGSRMVPGAILGEAFTASAAWQCVLACDAVRRGRFDAATVSVTGAGQQAIGARFVGNQ